MRFKCLSLFVILVVSACTFQVDILDTPTPQTSETAILSDTPAPTIVVSQDLPATPPPTIMATNTALPTAAGSTGISPIQFALNGTYVDIIESIPAGKSKTYSLTAMKGQVMSISFHQNDETEWTYITMQIVGEDDTVLCTSDCQFWRGILPITQNYFVTVTPSADAPNFMMRVAINPLGVVTQSFLYENKYRNASLSYTDLFAPAFFPGPREFRIESELVLQFIDTQSYMDTTLSEAYVLFGSSTDPQIVSVCTEPASSVGQQTTPENVIVHGIDFVTNHAVGVAAGSIYEQIFYRTVHEGTCFEIVYYMHHSNIGNYAPGTVTEFDRDALLQSFDDILSTLTLN